MGEPGRRADQRLHLRRPHDQGDAAGVPGLQLGAWRVPGRDHEFRGHGRRHRRDGHAARPDGDAAVLRLQHGRLFWPLAECRAPCTESPKDFPDHFDVFVLLKIIRLAHAVNLFSFAEQFSQFVPLKTQQLPLRDHVLLHRVHSYLLLM